MNTNAQQFVGQQIGSYEVRQHLARGGMADVYLAYDVDLQRKVALKIILPALTADSQFVDRFRREAQTAARLEHPCIVQVYSIGMANGTQPYIAMQFIEGGDLQGLIRQARQDGRKLTAIQALTITRYMADALVVAHNAGVIHRDLKPSNILIRPDGAPVMVDLGIAAVQGGPKLTHTGTLIGTPNYMSPEQAKGEHLDGRSDIYSLGVILYEMLAGKRPFEADDPLAVLHKHVYEQVPPLETARPDLASQTLELVYACLQKDPAHRPQTAQEMLNWLDYALEAEGAEGAVSPSGNWRPKVQAPPAMKRTEVLSPLTATIPLRPERPKWILPVAAGVVLLLAAVVGLFFVNQDDPPQTAVATLQPTSQQLVEVQPLPTSELAATSTTAPIPPTSTALPPTPLPTETAVPTPTPDLRPVSTIIGTSVLNQDIEAVRFGSGPNVVVLVGGLHAGFAPSTVELAERAIDYFTSSPQDVPTAVTLYIIPNASPDSPRAPGELAGRLNANGADLNRNWDCRWVQDAKWRNDVIPGSGGTEPFSEPETQALKSFIESVEPTAVIFWEARATNGLSSPGLCDAQSFVSGTLGDIYGFAAGYEVADFESLTNQEVNGDATNWLDSQGIPAIAVLLPDYESVDWGSNLLGILAVLRSY